MLFWFKIIITKNKSQVTSSENNTEIWFLDRSLQWHYLTDTFQNYYRLLIAHLGLPQWQALFTEDGLPPFLYVTVAKLILSSFQTFFLFNFLSQQAMVLYAGAGKNSNTRQQLEEASVSFDV